MIKNIMIKATVEEERGAGLLEAGVSAETEALKECGEVFLWAYLTAPDGAEADRIFPIPLEEQMQFCMQTENVRLWNTEEVCLYDLVLECRDAQNTVLERAVKKVAFYMGGASDGRLLINGREIAPRVVKLPPTLADGDRRDFLAACKRAHYNVLLAPKETLRELAAEYGLYLTTKEEWAAEEFSAPVNVCNPYFDFQITQQGVLIENRSTFQNASDYIFCCAVFQKGETEPLHRWQMSPDIPAGSGKYLEFPFEPPAQAGEYIYRAQLLYRADTAWAKQGEAAADVTVEISSLFGV